MPNITWRPSQHGGWFADDEHGNRWRMTSNRETVTVITPDGHEGIGWTPETAWNVLREAA